MVGTGVEGPGAIGERVVLERGTIGDYRELAHLHYAPGDPAVIAGVWRGVFRGKSNDRLIAVGVLAYATPSCLAREKVLGLSGARDRGKIRFLNEHVRTIARVIVHPQFRAMGIATQLV